ncbi:MAG: hypothetical protein AB7W16_03510 [Candidatus Obscuribacterales bacterium]
MTMLRVYVYAVGRKVVIPRMAANEEGIFIEVDPVSVFDVIEVETWKSHIYDCLSRDIDTLDSAYNPDGPGSAVLDKLQLERWADFEKNAVMYIVHRGSRYITVYATGKSDDGMWTTGSKERRFDCRAPLEIVVEEIAFELMREPEAMEPQPKLLMSY